LVPAYCAFPWPNDHFSVADADSPTGRRVALGDTVLPANRGGRHVPPAVLNAHDGWSASGTILTWLEGATTTGCATPVDIERSLAMDSPTVILDAETGERVAHFAELDGWAPDDGRAAFTIRPVVRLQESRRYIVALRGLVDGDGTLLAPSPAFQSLLDGTPTPAVASRQSHFESIFTALEAEGIARADLQLAWDFTTASDASNTWEMVAMRDAAFDALPDVGAPYRITRVEDDPNEHIARAIEGVIEVPLYLDIPGPGGVLTRNEEGRPTTTGTAEYPFLMLVPRSASAETPATLLQFGHGLFGQADAAWGFDWLANERNVVIFSMDWLGMARQDVPELAALVAAGEMERFVTNPDRNRQGFLNKLIMARTVITGMLADPAIHGDEGPLYDPARMYYFGGSQGGIFGASLMALHLDIQRGVLGVPGMAYSLMLPRSIHFDQFHPLLTAAFPDPRDVPLMLNLAQMLWDRSEPSGYARHIVEEPLPNTPAHEVVLIEAIGDHQVPNLASHLLARTIGAAHLAPVNRPLWGLAETEGPIQGAALIDMGYGLPPNPVAGVPQRAGDDPHGEPAKSAPVVDAMLDFYLTGTILNRCDGPCDPE
jgi:hypothetical protein